MFSDKGDDLFDRSGDIVILYSASIGSNATHISYSSPFSLITAEGESLFISLIKLSRAFVFYSISSICLLFKSAIWKGLSASSVPNKLSCIFVKFK